MANNFVMAGLLLFSGLSPPKFALCRWVFIHFHSFPCYLSRFRLIVYRTAWACKELFAVLGDSPSRPLFVVCCVIRISHKIPYITQLNENIFLTISNWNLIALTFYLLLLIVQTVCLRWDCER